MNLLRLLAGGSLTALGLLGAPDTAFAQRAGGAFPVGPAPPSAARGPGRQASGAAQVPPPWQATPLGGIHGGAGLEDVNAPPVVRFVSAGQSLGEGSAAVTLRLRLSKLSASDVTVPFSLGGTAEEGDFTLTPSPAVIPAGSRVHDLVLTPVDDALDEPDETVVVTLGAPTNATLGAPTEHVATLTDDDPEPTVAFDPASSSFAESASPQPITVQLSAPSGREVTVPYTLGGTAVSPDDYSITPSPLVIAAGQVSADLTLTPVDDLVEEGDETVVVTLGEPIHAGLGGVVEHVATLLDDDVNLVSDDFNHCEGLVAPWVFLDPLGGSAFDVVGVGGQDAWLTLFVPGGPDHEPLGNVLPARVVQPVMDSDFQMEVKFDSGFTDSFQIQGLTVEQDEGNWARFDFFRSGSSVMFFTASTSGGVTTFLDQGTIALVPPMHMRVTRIGDQWTQEWSSDGAAWNTSSSFSHVIALSQVGIYAGNAGVGPNPAPPFMAAVDYFFESSSPIVPEDGPFPGSGPFVLTAGTAQGNGAVSVDPLQPDYGCRDVVELTALPDPGWEFLEWSGDVSGSLNPIEVTMDADKTVSAAFQLDTSPPVISDVSVSATSGSATITWNTNEPADSRVDYGLTAGYGAFEESAAHVLAHSVEVDGLAPGEVYHYRITSTNAAGLPSSTDDDTFQTDPEVAIVSDDFNHCGGLEPHWTEFDPLGDATIEVTGVGTPDARLEIAVPAGATHECFHTLFAPRVMQPAENTDFQLEVKFDSDLTEQTQIQGLLVQQDPSNWLRFDFYANGSGGISYFVGSTTNATTTRRGNGALPLAGAPMWMRVTRVGNQWTQAWSADGMSFANSASFSHSLTVSSVGVYAGNSVGASSPAHVALVDYFFETATPIVPEDGSDPGDGPYSLTTQALGGGSVSVDPLQAEYFCSESVTLTAVPNPGATFDRWEGDVTGSVNPVQLVMDDDKAVTAIFATDTAPPVISNVNVTAFSTHAIVTWNTDEPANSSVDYGAPDCTSNESESEYVMQHSVTLTMLQPETTYCYRITSVDQAGLSSSTPDSSFTTESAGGFASDDFNNANLDLGLWEYEDPIGGGAVQLTGTGTSDARLVLIAPGGGQEYSPWTTNDSVRVLQPADDTDFEIEAKFEADLNLQNQVFGIAVEEDADSWMRFDFHFDGANVLAFAAGISDGAASTFDTGLVAGGSWSSSTPLYMAVRRQGTAWNQEYSFDGQTWFPVTDLSHSIEVSRVGLFAGNEGANPPTTTAVVDWSFNAAAPIAAEDFGVPSDSAPPYLYRWNGIAVTDSVVELAWASDEPATAVVEYGFTQSYELGVWDSLPAGYSQSSLVTGLMDDTDYHFRVTLDDAAVNSTVSTDLVVHTLPKGATGGPVFDVWYGLEDLSGVNQQPFGHLGRPQTWVNVLGNVRDFNGSITSLTYRLNGGAPGNLSTGTGDFFPWRLTGLGDFNVEIDADVLNPGLNDVLLTAKDDDDNEVAKLVQIDYTPGVVWPQSTSIDWSLYTDIQDAAQIVDGKWTIDDDPFVPGARVVRTVEMGYDRLIDIGDMQWTDYEVRFTMTAHQLDPNGFTPSSNSFAIGCILRWTEHVNSGAAQQPRTGFFPFGGVFVYRWYPTLERWNHYGTDFSPNQTTAQTPMQFGVTYEVRTQVFTEPNDARRYRFRVWERGTQEPAAWLFDALHGVGHGNDSGSLLLLAHHVDASFGNVTVTPLGN